VSAARRGRHWFLVAPLAAAILVAVVPQVALAARLWTLTGSPLTASVGVQVTVTLAVQNIGGSGGGDEMTCVQVDVPSSFAVSAVAVVSVKGQTQASVHGWQADVGPITGATRVTFKNPTDTNPLVGLPAADSAVFRITGTPGVAGASTWTGRAFDKPGSSGDPKCGSGTFPTESILLSVTLPTGATPTPIPTPSPTPTPTPVPTPSPTPTPTPVPTPSPTSAPTPVPTPRPTPIPTPVPTQTPSATATGTAPPSTASPAATPSPPASGSPSSSPVGGTTASGAPTREPGGQPAIIDLAPAPERSGSSDPPSGAAGPITLGGDGGGDGTGLSQTDLDAAVSSAFVELGLVGWTVPAVVMGVPGLLVVLVVLLQLAGAGAWVPVGRRWLSRLDRRPPPGRSHSSESRRFR
jgi:hypothetical protein